MKVLKKTGGGGEGIGCEPRIEDIEQFLKRGGGRRVWGWAGGVSPGLRSGRCEPRTECVVQFENQRTNGPVNVHLISWPSKAQNLQNLENIW